MTYLTKSNYTSYLDCPIRLWLEKNRKELLPPIDAALEEIFAQGQEVDDLARRLFPGGVAISGFNDSGWLNTQKAITKGEAILYQPSIVTADGLACRADIAVWNGQRREWDIFEVKSSTKVKDDHVYDVGFQRLCFERVGLRVGRVNVVHLDSTYVRNGEIDPRRIFTVVDVTEQVAAVSPEIERGIMGAIRTVEKRSADSELLTSCHGHDDDEERCDWPEKLLQLLPTSDLNALVADLPPDELRRLLEGGLLHVNQVPQEMVSGLGKIKLPPDDAAAKPNVQREALANELGSLQYPLYYFDYETYSPAIPWYDGFSPYQRIPFQFSLDVQQVQGGPCEHFDFLAESAEDPSLALARALKDAAQEPGTFVSWYSPFEKGVNEELGRRLPGEAGFLVAVNESMYDLMLVFKKGRLYDDPRFHGSASLKKVAPVLVGNLYEGLKVKEGGSASAAWPKLIGKRRMPLEEFQSLKESMLAYCAVDTLNMVKIMEVLTREAGKLES